MQHNHIYKLLREASEVIRIRFSELIRYSKERESQDLQAFNVNMKNKTVRRRIIFRRYIKISCNLRDVV